MEPRTKTHLPASILLALATLAGAATGCLAADDGPVTASLQQRVEDGGGSDLLIWNNGDGSDFASADVDAVVEQLEALSADVKLTEDELVAGRMDMQAHLEILNARVGLYADAVIARERDRLPVDDLQRSFENTPLAEYLAFDALLAANRVGDQVLMHSDLVEAWLAEIVYTDVQRDGAVDDDDDGDLDLFLVNAPGGDNVFSSCKNNLHQLGLAVHNHHDTDGDGEMELGLTVIPASPPAVLISLITPAIQSARATAR